MSNNSHILTGIVALVICWMVYLFIFVEIDFHAHPFLFCYTSAEPPYAEETIFSIFLGIGILWAFLLYNYPKEDGLWLKITAYGSWVFIALVLMLIVPEWIKREPFYDDFDAARWQVSEGVYSGRMARKLVHDKTLIGKHKDEVTEMLGEPTWKRGYTLNHDHFLSLYLEYDSDTVYRASLYCID